MRIFDVNLRQEYFSREVLTGSLALADVAKLNDAELPVVLATCGLPVRNELENARVLRQEFDLDLVCVTRGVHGSLLVSETESNAHPGYQVTVSDTIGAGDAFTAALAHHFARAESLATINRIANRVGSWVASLPGATPRISREEFQRRVPDTGRSRAGVVVISKPARLQPLLLMSIVYIATSNQGKLRDFQTAAAAYGIEIAPVPNISRLPAVVEDQDTFEGNARKKAEFYSSVVPDALVLGDDSGLEVDALGGAPGVISARYAAAPGAENSSDAANNSKLRVELASVPDDRRRARFVCVIAAARNGKVVEDIS